MSTYDEWKTDAGDDDPDGTAAQRDAEADEQAAHPERYEERCLACGGVVNIMGRCHCPIATIGRILWRWTSSSS